KGFVIFALDNRGSTGRGHEFEKPIHFRLGVQELADQKDGVAWLKTLPYVDRDRMGIWGGSYGGNMTLHLMFEDAEDFKGGIGGRAGNELAFLRLDLHRAIHGFATGKRKELPGIFAERKGCTAKREVVDCTRNRRRQRALCEHAKGGG